MKRNIIISLLIFISGYLAFSQTDSIVVTEQAKINSALGNFKEFAQGIRFWKRQLDLVNQRIKREEEFPDRMSKLNAKMDKMLDASKARMEQFYNKHPNLKPSEAEQYAEMLRDKADQIEQDEMNAKLEQLRIKRIEHLKRIKDAIIEKLNNQ